jgi:hypothetical protein
LRKPSSFPSRFELLISLGKELFLLASKLRLGSHIYNRTVEPDRVVMMDVLCCNEEPDRVVMMDVLCHCLTSIVKLVMLLARMQSPLIVR